MRLRARTAGLRVGFLLRRVPSMDDAGRGLDGWVLAYGHGREWMRWHLLFGLGIWRLFFD